MKEQLKELAKNAAVGFGLLFIIGVGSVLSAKLESINLYIILRYSISLLQAVLPFLGLITLGKLVRVSFNKVKSLIKRG